MIYYFLPGTGIYGGIKVGFQFVDLLSSAGARAIAVTPDGSAPAWFKSRASVLSEAEATQHIATSDWIMFSYPADYTRLKSLATNLVYHCQGTDSMADPVFSDAGVILLTCWKEAAQYARDHFARRSIEVGISVSSCFFFDGSFKSENLAAYMPRRGFATAKKCIRKCGGLAFTPIDEMHELDVSRALKKAGIFIATSAGEYFGLPALEAMAAGCLVLSVPVKGGMEYLIDRENCLIAEPAQLPDQLAWILRSENNKLRSQLRTRAVATAFKYRMDVQQKRVESLLQSELRMLR